MPQYFRFRLLAYIVNSAFLGSWCVVAHAQDALTEIVVTASKRGEQSIMDVPLAVQAISGDELQSKGITEISDFIRLVPGLAALDDGPGDKRYIIRGINSAGASTVGVYLDDAVITDENNQDGGGREPDVRMFDMDRVEVLKGPQGTTFGSSSLSGVIRYITNKPDLDDVQVSARTSLISTEHAAPGTSLDAMVNLPIVTDRVALRISSYYEDLPGYIDNRFTEGVNGIETKANRVQLRTQFADGVRLDLFGMHQLSSAAGRQGYNVVDYSGNPLPALTQATIAREPYQDEMWIYGGTFEAKVPGGTLTAIGSRETRTSIITRDASQVFGSLFGLPYDLPGLRSVIQQPKNRSLDSAEVRYASTLGGPFEFLAGAVTQRERRTYNSDIFTTNAQGYIDPSDGVLFGPIIQERSLETKITEVAGFSEITWQPVSALKLTAGGRVFKIDNESKTVARIAVPGIHVAGYVPENDSNQSSAIGRFNISYTLGSILFYSQVAQGYRAGGTNDQAGAELIGVTIPVGYKSDSLINYEIGAKGTAADNQLDWSLATYYIDWRDLQINLQATSPTNPGESYAYVGNAGAARSYGLEAQARWKPVRGLTISGTIGLTNARLTESVPGAGESGDRIPYVPQYTATLAADYATVIGPDFTGFLGTDVEFIGARYTDLPENLSNYHLLPRYHLVDTRLGIEHGSWKVSFVVKNIFDDKTIIDQNQTITGLTVDDYIPNRPRTYMLELSFRH